MEEKIEAGQLLYAQRFKSGEGCGLGLELHFSILRVWSRSVIPRLWDLLVCLQGKLHYFTSFSPL